MLVDSKHVVIGVSVEEDEISSLFGLHILVKLQDVENGGEISWEMEVRPLEGCCHRSEKDC